MISQAIKRISRGGVSGMMLLLLSMASCVNEPIIPDQPDIPSDIPEGMVRVGLYANAGDYQAPVSRAAANEGYNDASMPWVFVFSGNNDNAVFVEVKQAEPGGTSSDDTPYVILTKQSSPVRLLVMANAPATFFNGTDQASFTAADLNAALIVGSTSFAQAVNDILNTVRISSSPNLPYEGAYIPMSGALDLPQGIDKNTTIGTVDSKMDLRRIVAKVTVQNSASGFKLSSVSIAGAKQYGRLYQISPVQNITGNTTNYGEDIAAASAETTLANPLYIYESAPGETSVIIKGVYNGSTYYYKLAFKDPTDGSVMAVTRNIWYQFKITSVMMSGYSSFNEAIAGSPSNIAYTITVVDQSSYDMLDNGQFYLGLSNSEYLIYGVPLSGEQLTVATVMTNAASAMVSGINSVSVSGAGLSLVGGSTTLKLSTDGTTPISTDLKVTVSSTFASGAVTIKLGNMTKVISVVRTGSDGAASGLATLMDHHPGNQYTSATIGTSASSWLSVSTDGTTSRGSGFTQSGASGFLPVYLIFQNNPQGSPARQSDDIYLTHRNVGRIKVFVKQSSLVY